MKTLRWLALIGLVLSVVALLLATTASAAQQDGPRRKFRSGDDLTIAANETVPHDLYVAANNLTIDGAIEGDLIVFAREVWLNGRVTGDVLGAASRVTIGGAVEGDVRVAGARVSVGGQGRIGKDLLTATRDLRLDQGSTVRGDLIFVAQTSNLLGTIEGGILTTSGEVETATPRYAGTLSGRRRRCVAATERR
jgi:cytoskeletal protein CcmA (bactofilin family)